MAEAAIAVPIATLRPGAIMSYGPDIPDVQLQSAGWVGKFPECQSASFRGASKKRAFQLIANFGSMGCARWSGSVETLPFNFPSRCGRASTSRRPEWKNPGLAGGSKIARALTCGTGYLGAAPPSWFCEYY